MTDWKKYVAARDWDRFTHTMWSLDLEAQTALLAELQSIVPMTYDENGVEREERHVSAAEARQRYPELAGAASILEDGELEAAVLGDPPSDIEHWDGVRSNARALLEDLLTAEEVTSGSPELSQRGHARKALYHLDQIEMWTLDRLEQTNDEDRPIWEEIIALAAWNGIMAGSYAQRALGKRFEVDAVRGRKVAAGQKDAARETNARHQPMRDKRLAAMAEMVPQFGVDKAAAMCEASGLGPRAGIKRQWYRYTKTQRKE